MLGSSLLQSRPGNWIRYSSSDCTPSSWYIFCFARGSLSHWSTRKCCTKKEDLQSLIGRLHHACMVVWPGRTFLRQMIDLLSCFHNGSHLIRLNVEFRKDLAWWVEFFGQWNGISLFLFPTLEPLPDLMHLMHLVPLLMVLLWTTNGSMVSGLLSNFHLLLTRSFFQSF